VILSLSDWIRARVAGVLVDARKMKFEKRAFHIVTASQGPPWKGQGFASAWKNRRIERERGGDRADFLYHRLRTVAHLRFPGSRSASRRTGLPAVSSSSMASSYGARVFSIVRGALNSQQLLDKLLRPLQSLSDALLEDCWVQRLVPEMRTIHRRFGRRQLGNPLRKAESCMLGTLRNANDRTS